ncbi:hypothetical protein [Clostridium sp. UBA3061]|uniref:hypothetical protein n=1 Tax=Clostridium sp. UBA3061 TaxID=1946353 RepID=UPI003216CBAA
MKKFKLIYIGIFIMSLLMVGCGDKPNVKEEIPNKDISSSNPIIDNTDKDEIDNTIISERYKNVKKEDLTYKVAQKSYYFYESEDDLVSSSRLSEIPNIDDKKYGYILKDYTYACEVNPTDITYDEALDLIYKVLPDDIKKEREKFNKNNEIKNTNLIFSSSKGNFIVNLVHPIISYESGNETVDTNSVVGISYLREY